MRAGAKRARGHAPKNLKNDEIREAESFLIELDGVSNQRSVESRRVIFKLHRRNGGEWIIESRENMLQLQS
jgi:hypothetical protein